MPQQPLASIETMNAPRFPYRHNQFGFCVYYARNAAHVLSTLACEAGQEHAHNASSMEHLHDNADDVRLSAALCSYLCVLYMFCIFGNLLHNQQIKYIHSYICMYIYAHTRHSEFGSICQRKRDASITIHRPLLHTFGARAFLI